MGLDVASVALLIAKPATSVYVQPARALPVLRFAPEEVLSNLPAVIPKLAEVAALEGSGPVWALWLAAVEAAGLVPTTAVQELLEHEAHWFSAWCFKHDHLELGLTAYERVLSLKRELGTNLTGDDLYYLRIGLNPFSSLLYFLIALRLGASQRALRAFAPVREKLGCSPSDEVMYAAFRFLAGDVEADIARKIVARFVRNPSGLVQAACAVAFERLGDAQSMHDVLSGLDRDFGHSLELRQALSAQLGLPWDEAMTRPPIVRPKRKRTPGFVLKPSRTKAAHLFAPTLPRGPKCPTCARAQRVWFSLDLASVPQLAVQLPGWQTFNATACLDCDAWMRRHDLHLSDAFAVELLEVEPGTKNLTASAYGNDANRSIQAQFAKPVKAPRDLDQRPLDGDCQLGGDPAWIQEPVDVACPGCGKGMVFVLRFSSPNGFIASPEVAGGSGALYTFACGPCRRVAQIAQWT